MVIGCENGPGHATDGAGVVGGDGKVLTGSAGERFHMDLSAVQNTVPEGNQCVRIDDRDTCIVHVADDRQISTPSPFPPPLGRS